jgi:hypothetical protein
LRIKFFNKGKRFIYTSLSYKKKTGLGKVILLLPGQLVMLKHISSTVCIDFQITKNLPNNWIKKYRRPLLPHPQKIITSCIEIFFNHGTYIAFRTILRIKDLRFKPGG